MVQEIKFVLRLYNYPFFFAKKIIVYISWKKNVKCGYLVVQNDYNVLLFIHPRAIKISCLGR